ncbi:MAG: signal recognition particle-docking protein FtsY [Dethiobacteria bacterium]|nr:signal recognition particle-docking protein FtsY [Dethiobacteria bacterium]
MSLIEKFKNGLLRSKSGFIGRLERLFSSGELNDEFYDELEEIMVSGDVGIATSLKLVGQLREDAGRLKLKAREETRELLRQSLINICSAEDAAGLQSEPPLVILLVGVNGSGKTTSAAKLANLYRSEGKKVLMVAGDTFRAAAVEQLEVWAQRAGVDLIKQQAGSDPSALFFDAMNSARAREFDVVIGDTAGRLHNKFNLMEELNKIYRVIGRNMPGAPHQVLLVIDATTGQNAMAQAISFNEALPLSGLILTKLDGTARGGIVVGIQDSLDIPVRYIGTGEKMEDMAPFNAEDFVNALMDL